MTELVTWVTENFSSLITIGTNFIGAFAIIASMTPNTSDNTIVDALYSLVNLFGFNIGNAANK